MTWPELLADKGFQAFIVLLAGAFIRWETVQRKRRKDESRREDRLRAVEMATAGRTITGEHRMVTVKVKKGETPHGTEGMGP